ncbi:DUF1772 domain-containing protein [Streptomyces katrae]|uniref:DUF1772 domain-containing protein n=1 Tax=Streptomyces katrae TaxID=68223 RepID=UPI000A79A36E|nr:DUF1772 domain-containing protein [Streptomyces katrae]
MKMNGITMQAAMAVSILSSLALAAFTRGRARLVAGSAGMLALASFLTTRFGNVPINGRIKEWARTSASADHAEVLRRWELFNDLRTLTAVAAFVLLIALSLGQQKVFSPGCHIRLAGGVSAVRTRADADRGRGRSCPRPTAPACPTPSRPCRTSAP